MEPFEKIDGLRAVAISFVLVEHFGPWLGHRITAGYYGVDLFFVISGFLVTSILARGRKPFPIAYRNFVGRRTLRIFPLYYATLGLMLLIYPPARDALLYLATYTYNYAWVALDLPSGSLSHFWSLAVEEQFYLVWPLVVLPLRRFPRVLGGLAAGLAGLCFFQLLTDHWESVQPYDFVGLFPRAGSLLVGAVGALVLQYRRAWLDELFKNILLEWMVFATLGASLVIAYPWKYPVLAACSLYLVLKAAHSDFCSRRVNRFLTDRRVLHVGRVSYGIYIFHVPLGIWITEHLVAPWWYVLDFDSWGRLGVLRDWLWVVLLPLFAVLSVGLATASHRWFEKPILSLKDRWFA